MKRKALITGGALLLLVAVFLAGRYSRPARVEERVKVETKVETRIEWRDRVVEKKVSGPVRVVERIIKEKDGDVVTERTIDRAPVIIDRTDEASGQQAAKVEQASESVKVTENPRPRFRLGVSLPPRYPVDLSTYQLEGDVRLVGTLWLGARYVHNDGTPFRVALGLEF